MTERQYEVYCGNYECPTRLALETHLVSDSDLIDGEVWLCPDCRAKVSAEQSV